MQKQGFKTNLVETGGKIMTLECVEHKMKCVDSLNFIPMPLKKFPKLLVKLNFKKDHFPHLFNLPGNQDYKGEMSDKEFF